MNTDSPIAGQSMVLATTAMPTPQQDSSLAEEQEKDALMGAPMSKPVQHQLITAAINRHHNNFKPRPNRVVSRRGEAVAHGINQYALGQLKFYLDGLALQSAFNGCINEFYSYYLKTLIHAYEIYMMDICKVSLTDTRNDTLLLIRGMLSRAEDNHHTTKQCQHLAESVAKRVHTQWYVPRKNSRLYQILKYGATDAAVVSVLECIIEWQADHLEKLYRAQLNGGDTQALQEQVEIQQAQIAKLGEDMAALKEQLSESDKEKARLQGVNEQAVLEIMARPVPNRAIVIDAKVTNPKPGWMSLFRRKSRPQEQPDVIVPVPVGHRMGSVSELSSGL